jgi:hypothetical protein
VDRKHVEIIRRWMAEAHRTKRGSCELAAHRPCESFRTRQACSRDDRYTTWKKAHYSPEETDNREFPGARWLGAHGPSSWILRPDGSHATWVSPEEPAEQQARYSGHVVGIRRAPMTDLVV